MEKICPAAGAQEASVPPVAINISPNTNTREERASLFPSHHPRRMEEDEMYYHSEDELLGEGDTLSQGSLSTR